MFLFFVVVINVVFISEVNAAAKKAMIEQYSPHSLPSSHQWYTTGNEILDDITNHFASFLGSDWTLSKFSLFFCRFLTL